MKNVLSGVLAVAMVLGCVASLAFVVGDQSGTTFTNAPLQIEGFYVTDSAAWTEGVQAYSELTELTDALYAKNNIIRFAVELSVMNSTVPSNGTRPTDSTGEKSTLIFKSDTVDFSMSTNANSMVLYKPFAVTSTVNRVTTDSFAPNLTTVVKGPTAATNNGIRLDAATGDLELDVYAYTVHPTSGKPAKHSDAVSQSGFSTKNGNVGLHLVGVSDNISTLKTDFTLVLTGVTKGELTQEGLVTLERVDSAADTFEKDGQVVVTKNGHTYWIQKWYDTTGIHERGTDGGTMTWGSGKYWNSSISQAEYKGELKDAYGTGDDLLNWTHNMQWDVYDKYPAIYDINAVGYVVRVLLNDNDAKTIDTLKTNGTWGVIGMFETEQIRYGSTAGDLEGTDVENMGISLGFDYWGPTDHSKIQKDENISSGQSSKANWQPVAQNILTAFGSTKYYAGSVANPEDEVFKAGKNGDHLYGGVGSDMETCQSQYMTAREALTTFLSDFNLGTGSQYTYKVQDAVFTEAATFEELGRATYNGNAIVIEQPEENPDVDEGTGEEEIPDEGDIGEELPDEGDIDEEPIPDEPVPETGDASAAVAVALTAAALVAAAGLAVVLKKAR